MEKAYENRLYKYTALSALLVLVFAFGRQETESSMEKFTSKKSMLTVKQMEEIIGRWDEHTIISHKHADDQISMKEAIDAGKDWLVQMGMTNGVSKVSGETYSASARLVTSLKEESMERQPEPYYSSWFVRFTGPSVTAFLYINAVTGTVWSADITLYEDLTEKVSFDLQYLLFYANSKIPLSAHIKQ